MNIKENIINYLKDKNYIITIYDNHLYVYRYTKIITLNDHLILFVINKKKVTIKGLDLKVEKMTDDEFIINGDLKNIDIGENYEKD